MKKIAKFISAVLIAAAVIFVLHFVLTLEAVDTWLTEKIGGEAPADASLIRTEWAGERYGFAETDRPCIFAREDRLYLMAGEDVADITPEEINISYYGSFMDFNEILSYKKNCVVSEDGRYIVYRLEFNDIPYLYYYDIEARKAYFISDRVDSFDLVENDGTEALTLIYATGYAQKNKLFLYRSDPAGETAGSTLLLSEDNAVSGVFEAYGSIVSLSLEGTLSRYDPASGAAQTLSEGVEALYFPGDSTYNYDDYYKEFTVCCRKGGQDYILNGSAEAVIEGGYYNVIPKYTYSGVSGETYYYSLRNKRIVRVSGGAETVLYEELGDLYHVFLYVPGETEDEPGSFVAASGSTLYLLAEDGDAASELMRLPGRYRRHAEMLEEHMAIYPAENGVYYVAMLASGSLVFNTKNVQSWMNAASSYNYGLTVLREDAGEYTAEPLNVPFSRSIEGPVPAARDGSASNNLIHVSYFADGTVKAVSLLSAEGALLSADMLGTSGYAQGQCVTEVFSCSEGTYILRKIQEENADFYFLSGTDPQLAPAADETGVLAEANGDFTAAVSFGTLVIF